MQLQCPSCNHGTTLPDRLVGEDGQDLTCPKCSASFTVLAGGFTALNG